MQISPEEAQESLADIDRVISQTRRAIAGSGSDLVLIIWGIIWMLGYGVSQFRPQWSGLIWMILVWPGAAASWLVASRKSVIKSPQGQRIGFFWLALFAFAGIWLFILAPFNTSRLGAFFATVPMFGYVVAGLWLGRFWIILGASVTALTLLGLAVAGDYFNLWMAAAGGGSLLVSGIYIRRYWK